MDTADKGMKISIKVTEVGILYVNLEAHTPICTLKAYKIQGASVPGDVPLEGSHPSKY